LQEIDPMTKTVTSLFPSEQRAAAAASRLEQVGLPRDGIDIWSTPHNLAPLLEDAGVSRADAYAYAEGVVQGGTVVIVQCEAAAVDRVVGILDQEGALDLSEQQVLWRSDGWQGYAAAGQAGDLTGSPEAPQSQADLGNPGSASGHGRVRVHTRKEERPAQT
jgi:hypothetical protein